MIEGYEEKPDGTVHYDGPMKIAKDARTVGVSFLRASGAAVSAHAAEMDPAPDGARRFVISLCSAHGPKIRTIVRCQRYKSWEEARADFERAYGEDDPTALGPWLRSCGDEVSEICILTFDEPPAGQSNTAEFSAALAAAGWTGQKLHVKDGANRL